MGIILRTRQYNDKTDLTMKISAIFVCAAAASTTFSRHARSQASFEEILGDDYITTSEPTTSEPNAKLNLMIRINLMIRMYLDDYEWPITASIANTLTSYGCWCQIRNQAAGGTVVPGHGQPVDELDRLCHKWHQCRSCTTIDSTECDPNTINYPIAYQQGQCASSINQHSECMQNTCKCDEELARELAYAANDRSKAFSTNN